MKTLGSLIKARRNERGLSQQALADLCGTSDSEIAKIERGERKSPNCRILCRMAKALGYHPLELLKVSGFLTNADVSSSLAIQGLEQLSDLELSHVQAFVDFLIKCKSQEDMELKDLEQAK
ncbi:transcriptional regulator [Bifidobacterium dentium]|uniref:helix-turn-helix domain-containing protein n=1 Tax=Bifidobacterium dentium TaxID=1689 RepID=UPI0018B0A60A|nr:helix-turn-helix transcriptional regulator [Bifidobacterium dentium]MBF9668188.1 transcriptional regulator [Bifidobacterium dentium]